MSQDAPTDFTRTLASGGAAAEPSSSAGVSRITSHSLVDEGRFVPGTLLNGRYRIIGLLGRGGMGEVYRATDLTLGQSVALKFLPEAAAQNERLLERFHSEVRVARQVSHPNVSRVYDIGQADGVPFISMEYVDGDDLGTLLGRIGRLPADKAIETARKICAGLAAAHDRGIIHRDLKPQNIMLNRRGEVVIMDFGLAAIADQLTGMEARNGTPAYMSPEQLKGSEVTGRSDIYALGLVLYELFTGRKPYEAKSIQELIGKQESSDFTSVMSIAADSDASVDKVIRRCLDPEPSKRPASALAVAAALPGGDPLAAALAAGETPSPEMVAAAGKKEGLALRYSIPCLVVVFAGIAAMLFLNDTRHAIPNSNFELPPDVLARKAREVAAQVGYPRKPADWHVRLSHLGPLMTHLNKLPKPHPWRDWLAAAPSVISIYRESPRLMIAQPFGELTADNPAPIEPGMVSVTLDANARLRGFSAIPYRDDPGAAALTPERVFELAGLDIAKFSAAEPPRSLTVPADHLAAWSGPHPVLPQTPVTVEMGFWKGQLTHLRLRWPWTKEPSAAAAAPTLLERGRDIATPIGLLSLLVFGILLARRNWRLGRCDRRGALRLFWATVFLGFLQWLGTLHPVADSSMVGMFATSLGTWLLAGSVMWLLYLALEPALRSRWPHSIVTWNRLLAGRFLDPQVSAHILIGAACGTVMCLLLNLYDPSGDEMSTGGSLMRLLGPRQWLSGHGSLIANALQSGLIVFFAIFGLRQLLRRDWLAAIAAAVFFSITNSQATPALLGALFVIYLVICFVLLRLGLVVTVATMYVVNSLGQMTIGFDWSQWHAGSNLSSIAVLLALGGVAFWRSLGEREILGEDAAPAS